MLEVLRATHTQAFVDRVRAALPNDTLALLHPQATAHEEADLRHDLAAIALRADTLTLLSTSGSTGRPKRVELSRGAWLAHAAAANRHLDVRADDRWLVTLPLAHTGGLSIVLRCHVAGATPIVADVPRLGAPFAAFVAAQLEHVTRLSLVPAQLSCLLDGNVAPGKARSVLLGGQAASPTLVARALDRGWPIVTSYGMTETCGMCVASAVGARSDAVGVPLPNVRLRIADTLELRSSAQATAVHGASSFTADGWLRTADRARLQPDGLVILGRADDVIVSSGNKIDPLELETAIAALPGVTAVAVAGVEHPLHGATVGALLVTSTSVGFEHIAAYKRPRIVVHVDALPLLPSGKVDRIAVRERLRQSLG